MQYSKSALIFMDMATIKDSERIFREFVDGYSPMLENAITTHKDFAELAIREQLESGIDGNEKELQPNYLNDPYFKTRKEALRYMRWKERITPPVQSQLGLRERPVKTPNLRINGYFHNSIQAVSVDGGISLRSHGVDFAPDVEHKYGDALYKLGRTARRKFYRDYIRTSIKEYYRRFGL